MGNLIDRCARVTWWTSSISILAGLQHRRQRDRGWHPEPAGPDVWQERRAAQKNQDGPPANPPGEENPSSVA
jgi:hypothetical protein